MQIPVCHSQHKLSLSCAGVPHVVLRYSLAHVKGKQWQKLSSLRSASSQWVLPSWTRRFVAGVFWGLWKWIHLLTVKSFLFLVERDQKQRDTLISQRSDHYVVKRISLHSRGNRLSFVDWPNLRKCCWCHVVMMRALQWSWSLSRRYSSLLTLMDIREQRCISLWKLRRADSVSVFFSIAQFWKSFVH